MEQTRFKFGANDSIAFKIQNFRKRLNEKLPIIEKFDQKARKSTFQRIIEQRQNLENVDKFSRSSLKSFGFSSRKMKDQSPLKDLYFSA